MSGEAGFFSIDVDAEVRKLTARQFASEADQIAEVLRTAIVRGAEELHLQTGRRGRLGVGRRGWRLWAPGARLADPLIDWLALAADPRADPDARHRAVVASERGEGLGVLALLSFGELRLRAGGRVLAIGAGTVERGEASPLDGIEVRALRPLARAQVEALGRALRYAAVPTWVDGAAVSRGFSLDRARDDVVLAGRFERAGIEAVVGLPRDDELCRTIFLDREVVLRERAGLSPSGECHLAVVVDRQARGPGDVRTDEALDLVRAGRARLYEEAAMRFGELATPDRAVVRRLLLRKGTRARSGAPVHGLPLFTRLDRVAVDSDAVRAAAADGMVWAVGGASARRPVTVEAARVFVLDDADRAFLSAAHDLCFAEPPVRERDGWTARLGRRLTRGARGLRSALAAAIAGLRRPRAVPLDELQADERALAAAVEFELRGGRFLLPGLPSEVSRRVRVEMVERGPLPARTLLVPGGAVLAIPRQHPDVRAAVVAHREDPVLIYPVMALLLAGADGYGARKQHLQRHLLAL